MYLADCLRDKYPDAVKFCSIGIEPMMEEIDRIILKDSVIDTPSESGSKQHLKSSGWIGSLEIEWAGSPIHFRSIFMQECLSYRPLVLIAARCAGVLRNFLSVLSEYGCLRERGKTREILVTNGQNIPVSTVNWEDLVLPPGMADDIRGNVEAFFRSRNKYRELGIPHRRGFLFAGPPGCGKTLTVKVLAATIDAKVITVLPQADVNDYEIKRAFELGKKHAPCMIVFEELEKLVRGQYVSLASFLNLVDGLSVTEGVLLVATSNDPASLDPALLHRPSRFDRVWKFPLPGSEQRLALLRKRGRAYFSEDALSEVARNSAGFSMAYVQEIVVNALLLSATNRAKPADEGLLQSLDILKRQRRAASKIDEAVEDRGTVGFGPERGVELRHLP
jgi:SpoVK/Ycf46/Vps4 family AAA+-type ATPase